MKTKVEDCKQIKIYPMIRTLLSSGPGQITWDNGFQVVLTLEKVEKTNYIKLAYDITNEEVADEECSYTIRLTKTKCNIAGYRYWFICPLVVEEKICGKRTSVLYLPPYEKYFGCRHCHNLLYESQCLSGHDKKFGRTISFPDLNRENMSFKRRTYSGFFTKKYRRFLTKAGKNYEQSWDRLDSFKKQLLKNKITTDMEPYYWEGYD